MRGKLVKKLSVMNILVLFLILLAPFLYVQKVEAAAFQQAYVRLDRLKASTYTSGLVCVKTPSTDTGVEDDVQVVFPSDFTVSETLTDWAVSTTNIPTDATAWTGIAQATAASNSTKTVTFDSGSLTLTSNLYCFRWTNNTAALQTGSSGDNKSGSITTRATGPSNLDSSNYATSIISNDQIVISATVPALFSVTFGDGGDPDSDANTDSFNGNLSTSSVVSTYGNTLTLTTNAAAGWVAWVKSANAALNSVSTGGTIATAGSVDNDDTDLSSATGYVLDVNITTQGSGGTGTVTQASNYGQEYDGLNSTSGGTLATTFQPMASSDGTTDGDVLTLIERAKISSVQVAATDYTDTLTVVAAGRF